MKSLLLGTDSGGEKLHICSKRIGSVGMFRLEPKGGELTLYFLDVDDVWQKNYHLRTPLKTVCTRICGYLNDVEVIISGRLYARRQSIPRLVCQRWVSDFHPDRSGMKIMTHGVQDETKLYNVLSYNEWPTELSWLDIVSKYYDETPEFVLIGGKPVDPRLIRHIKIASSSGYNVDLFYGPHDFIRVFGTIAEVIQDLNEHRHMPFIEIIEDTYACEVGTLPRITFSEDCKLTTVFKTSDIEVYYTMCAKAAEEEAKAKALVGVKGYRLTVMRILSRTFPSMPNSCMRLIAEFCL